MSPKQFLQMLGRRWLTIAACLLAFLALSAVVALLSPKKYSATAEVFVTVNYFAGAQPPGINSTSDFGLAQVQSYVHLATSPQVLIPARAVLGKAVPKSEITATNPPNTVLIDVVSTSSNAVRASRQANVVAKQLTRFVPKVAPRLPDGRSAVEMRIVQPATVPADPSSPNLKLDLLLGLLLGLASGRGIALVKEQFDEPEKART